jgi:hypothetical protein
MLCIIYMGITIGVDVNKLLLLKIDGIMGKCFDIATSLQQVHYTC